MTPRTSYGVTIRRRITGFLGLALSVGMIASGLSLANVPAVAAGSDDPVSVGTLKVENRSAPLGIDAASPRFSWITTSAERDVTQESYRIRVATSSDDVTTDPLWDSGTVVSDASIGVSVDGDVLTSMTDYYWQVDVSTSAGDASATSTFSTGMYSADDWGSSTWIGNDNRAPEDSGLTFTNAKWIWTPEPGAPYSPGDDRAFRKTLTAPEGHTAVKAEIMITADDSYTLWVNGDQVGKTSGTENGWQGSKLYTVDLNPTSNVIAARTTNGANTPSGLLVVVRVTLDDGSTSTSTTDDSWKAVKETPANFFAPSFDDSSWPAAAIQATYGSGPWSSNVHSPVPAPNPTPLLRKEFTVDDTVKTAKLYLAAGGYANVSLNGSAINDDLMTPGFTDYDDHVQYVVNDVTDQVHSGSNALGMELGRGFYGMTNPNVWWWEKAPWHGEPNVRAILRVTYEDGETKDIVTDDSWKIHDGAETLDDLYGGENYDARKVQTGFDTVGFTDTGWIPAHEVGGPKGELINQQQQPIRVTEELAAESITKIADDDYVVKFPRVIAGTVRFTAQGAAGATIRAQYGEKLLDDGRPDFSNNGGFGNGFQTDRFTLAGTGHPETWAGNFSYKGFQFIEVTGWPGGEEPPLEAFTALVMHTDAVETGSFATSNDIMNRTHRAVVDTLANNIYGIPTDTPMFEKNGWTGDAAVGAEMFLMNLDTQNLFEKWIGDINDSRGPDGAPYVIAPSSSNWGDWGVAPPWHSAYILIPSWLYQYGGDIQVLQKYYDGMKKYVDLEYSRSPGGIVPDSRLGDWVSPEASPAGGNAPEDIRVSATAYLYTMLTSMEKTATQLGKSTDAASFASNATEVKDAFNEEFLDTEKGYYRGVGDRGYRQTHNVLALAFGLAPDEAMAKRVAASIAADVEAKGNKLNTGSLGTKYLLPVLTDYGYADLAYKVASQTAYPSWGFMIENGATSMWEHWSLEARSHGHYFLGTVEDWFFHYVGGIQASPTTGYRDVSIAPAVTEQLDWAKTTTQTPFGPVSTDWSKTDGVLTLKTHIPVGSTATVRLPAPNSWAVTEGGNALNKVTGVHTVTQDDASVLVTVGSGDYSFDVNPDAGLVGTVVEGITALQQQADTEHTAGSLNQKQYDDLSALIGDAQNDAEAALSTLTAANPAATATKLAKVIGDIDAIDNFLTALDSDEDTVTALSDKASAVRTALNAGVSNLLGVTATGELDAAAYKPGMAGEVDATVTNTGDEEITDVTASVRGLDDQWNADSDIALSEALAGGKTAAATLDFDVPLEQLPGDVSATTHAEYAYGGARVGIDVPLSVTVDSPVTMPAVTFTPATVEPGSSADLTATVHNDGQTAAVGHLEVVAPDGWKTPLPTSDVIVPAGEDAELSVPVFAPIGTDHSPASRTMTAKFVFSDVVFASKTADITVKLGAITSVPDGYDHVDLGDSTSEAEHNLTASSKSGTNIEAGLTRRYANQLDDNSHFEFDTAVIPGKPFLLRAIETYDKAQTKKYSIFVNDVEVTERLFTHTGGLGTETYEVLIPAEYATDSTVRIRFQYGTDHAFYDPSIADVWTLPVSADTVAPQVVASIDPAAPDRSTGWYTTTPVSVSLTAQDERDGDVTISAAQGDGALTTYTSPFELSDDGEHTVKFQATDAAGNTSALQKLGVKIDTVKPATSVTLGDEFDGDIAKNAGTVHFTATDATSGVASTSYRVNEGQWKNGDSVTVDHEGDFTLEYFSTDVAGNVGATKSVSGTIVIPDLTPPTVDATVSHSGADGWYLDGAAVTISASDDDSGVASVEYQLGSDDWAAYNSPVTLPEGVTSVQFRATDNEGNVSAASSLTAKVDATMPTAWGWLSNSGHVVAVAQDQGSGPAQLQFSRDGETWLGSLSELVRQDAKPHTVTVRAVDVAGNVGESLTLERTSKPGALNVEPGEQLLVEASGFTPGSTVRVELHSTVRVELHSTVATLATTVADTAGVVTAFGIVPSDFEAGAHSLVLIVEVADGGSSDGSGTVTIPTNVVADTGSNVVPGVLFGGLVLLLGCWLVVVRRRRRSLVG